MRKPLAALITATTAFAAVAAPLSALSAAQAGAPGTRLSSVPMYHLMQLEVQTEQVSVKEFKDKTQAIRDCSEVTPLAKELGAKTVRNRNVRSSALPKLVQDLLSDLETGRATVPFGTTPETARVLILCNRF